MKFLPLLLASSALLSAQRITPNPKLTPGAVLNVTAADVCVVGYSKAVRNVPIALKRRVYREYGVRYVPRTYELDHLVPLELAGSNAQENLWVEPYNTVWNAHVKDDLENALHKRVCRSSMTLEEAQREIATDWIGTYKRIFYTNEPRVLRHKERD